MDAAASGAERTEEEWWLALLAAALSSVVAGAAAIRVYVERALGQPSESRETRPVVDAAIGLVLETTAAAVAGTRTVRRAVRPVSALVLRPPLLPERLQPQAWLDALAHEGRTLRTRAAPLLDGIVPAIVDAALDRVDLTELVSKRVDVDRIAERVDVDRIVERVDFAAVIDRIPIDRVLDRVDIDKIVAGIDLDAIVDRIDLDGIAARLDVHAVIDRIDRVDLATLARQIIDDVDLPDIIRESTGAMGSEAMIGLRMQGIEADQRVSQIIDRILLRRNARKTRSPTRPGGDDETAE